jgi:hypothetical protein
MACAICETRRPRRYCPAVRGDICAPCCGTEREVTVDCPFDCEYLQQSRKLGRQPLDSPPEAHSDIEITEEFLARNEDLMIFLGQTIFSAAIEMPGTVDFDVREALEGLTRTYRTMASGIYYESIPSNPLAANLFRAVQQALPGFREQQHQRSGVTRTRDADVLGVLIFLERIEKDQNNGRRRGRAFLDGLRGFFPPKDDGSHDSPPSLILP